LRNDLLTGTIVYQHAEIVEGVMIISLPWNCPYQEHMESFLKSLNHEVKYTETTVTLIEGFSVKDNAFAKVAWNYLWAKYHGLPLTPQITDSEYEAACQTLRFMADLHEKRISLRQELVQWEEKMALETLTREQHKSWDKTLEDYFHIEDEITRLTITEE
jgi:hypothetical protein